MSSKNRKKKTKILHLNPKISIEKYIKKFARGLPISDILITSDPLNTGTAQVIIAREKMNGEKIFASLFIDFWCMGVKDVIYDIVDEETFETICDTLKNSIPTDSLTSDPNFAFNLIYGAVEYAEDLGIAPHKDFEIAQYVLDDVEDIEYIDITFGRDGKPVYIPSENDNVGKILKTLNDKVGPENYVYLEEGGFDPMEELKEALDELVILEEDKTEYLTYLSISLIIHSVFENDLKKLKNLYLHDQPKLLYIILSNMDKVFDGEKNDDPLDKEFLLPVLEKYIIYEDLNFIHFDEFISSFDSTLQDDPVSKIIHHTILYSIGKDKVTKLCHILSSILASDKSAEERKASVIQYYDDFQKNPEPIWDEEPLEVGIILEHLTMHSEAFGVLNLEGIDYPDNLR